MRTPLLFILVATVAYSVIVAIVAVLGGASSEAGDVTISLAPSPFSNGIRGFLWVGLGTTIGMAVTHGPMLPAQVRQVLRGSLWAVGTLICGGLCSR